MSDEATPNDPSYRDGLLAAHQPRNNHLANLQGRRQVVEFLNAVLKGAFADLGRGQYELGTGGTPSLRIAAAFD